MSRFAYLRYLCEPFEIMIRQTSTAKVVIPDSLLEVGYRISGAEILLPRDRDRRVLPTKFHIGLISKHKDDETFPENMIGLEAVLIDGTGEPGHLLTFRVTVPSRTEIARSLWCRVKTEQVDAVLNTLARREGIVLAVQHLPA